MLHKTSIAAACALLLFAAVPLCAQTPVRGSSTSSSSRSATTVRAASSGAKTTTTGSSQSGRATVDRRETTVSNSNITNKGLTTVRTTTGATRSTTDRPSTSASSSTPVRSGNTTASSGSTTRQGSTTSSGTTARAGSSTAQSSSGTTATQSSSATARQSSGTTSQTARQQGATQTSHATTNQNAGSSQQGSSATSRTSQSGTAVRSNSNVTAKPQNTGRPERNDTYTDRGGNYRYGGAGNMNVYGDGRDVQRMPPMDRPPIPYSAPAIFNKKRPHYYGYNIASMPHGYVVKKYWGRDYYYYNGIWYSKGPQYYQVCRPPYHTEVTFGCCKKGLTSVRFSYYNSVERTYSAINENYAIIAEQNRIIAQNNAIIAQQNARLALNSTNANLAYLQASQLGLIQSYASATTQYYYQDGVFYTGSGHNFRTIMPPAGAIVASLPEDYIIVQYGGNPYYRVEDTLYRQFVVDGAPYFEVLGQFPF